MLDLEKLKQDFEEGKAVSWTNTKLLIEEIERLQEKVKKLEVENKKLREVLKNAYTSDLFPVEVEPEVFKDGEE